MLVFLVLRPVVKSPGFDPRDPDFPYGALETTVCGFLIKESRMKFHNANNYYRKSG